MKKNLLEILKKYQPEEFYRGLLLLADPETIRVRADQEQRILWIDANFSKVISKKDLYTIEEQIRRAYDLQLMRLQPHYPMNCFGEERIPDLLCELNRRGAVANGFFNHCTYYLDGGNLLLDIPFTDSGVDLVSNADAPTVLEEIIREEYGVSIKVTIRRQEDFDPSLYQNSIAAQMDELERAAAEAEKNYDPNPVWETKEATEPEKEILPRALSIYSDDPTPQIEEGICKIGHSAFDIGKPEFIFGESFEITPIAIASITRPVRNIVILGEIFGYKEDASRTGDKIDVTFDIFDGNASIEHRSFGLDPDAAKELHEMIYDGAVFAMRGSAKQMTRKGKTDLDFTFFYTDLAKIQKIGRKDTAENRRVELHLHTTMSTMDAIIAPDVAVKTAYRWGHPAVAITDHGNVQAFPDAMLALEKIKKNDPDAKLKVLYGMESYFVNDTAGAVSGKYDPSFEQESVVFDIETTGLSVQNCYITEIGAVKIQNGEIKERFNTFVDPEHPIPEEIVKLTGITDEMVQGAPKISDALQAFFDFIGKGNTSSAPLLIAHNANFDIGFIRYFAELCGLPFENPYLDTVALSRYINPDLNSHKLDVIATYYGLGEFNHHRACDDAEMLAQIYFCMLEKLRKMEIHTLEELQREMTENSDPLKLKPYHQILLVQNKTGLKNLYKLVSMSYLNYYKRFPRIPKTVLEAHREGLIVGSACEAGELFRAILENRPENEIEEIVNFYDYLEIQPICNNRFLIAEGTVADDEGLRNLNRRIVALGEKYGKPVCATCDAHFLNREDELYRKILLAGMKYKDYDREVGLYLRTTEEMLAEFSYLGEEKAYEVVVSNPQKIADMVDADVRPIPSGSYAPEMEGAEDELQQMCWNRAREQYGDPLPEIVSKRLEKELHSIIKNGFAVLYLIAQRLVHFSEEQGYLVGSRGSVGSSFVATMAGISEVNPLPPHYYCPNPACKHSEFFEDGSVGSGFDLPDKNCPKCGTKYRADGHDIMFETFLGFYGDKSPDIDLNFSGDVQGRVHKYTEELFGEGHVFRAGTLGTLADKTAYGYVAKYVEQKGISLSRAEMNRLVMNCVGVKKTTGQHPGGIIVVPQKYDVYDFTPIQHPADDPDSDIITTHFAFSYLHDTILKLDELGHDIPTKYKWLETFTNTSVLDVAMNDSSVYELLESTRPLGVTPEDIDSSIGTFGLPELGTPFVQQVLLDAKPHTFADLLQISGLTHGTNVWLGNAQDLIKDGYCDISRVIGTRDGIMIDLIRFGLENAVAFKIMEAVRKGKGLTPEWEADMRAHQVPEWYIGSCKKIKYLFPKAHAAAYVISAIRLAWYKVHKPVEFYCTMFTVAPNGFDANIVMGGKNHVVSVMKDIQRRGKDASPKEQASVSGLQLINEALARHIRFLPVDLEKSHSYAFLPENGAIRMPFSSLPGLGESAAQNIIAAREEEPFFSVEDLQTRARLSKAVIDILRNSGALDHVDETDQLTIRF